MKRKLFKLIIPLVTLFFFPLISGAQQISWTSQQYEASATAEAPIGPWVDVEYGPPLPISATATFFELMGNELHGGQSRSYIESNRMRVWSYDRAGDGSTSSSASFEGTFVSYQPYFQFIYDLSSTGITDSYLVVEDITDGISLYNEDLNEGSGTLYVPIASGHEIQARFAISGEYYSEDSYDSTLLYSFAVVPEPISSILFITGGSLLAGRRYIKRKKTA